MSPVIPEDRLGPERTGAGPPDTGRAAAPEHAAAAPPGAPRRRLVEIVIPAYNEQHVLAASVERLHAYLAENLPYPFRITIADNASTDASWEVALDLAERYARVDAVHLDQKGRGRALRAVWAASDAEVVAYMDADLSTGLEAFLPLIAPLMSGHSDLAIGSRLARGAAVVRGPKREFVSRGYNLLLRSAMAARFSDAQCGFKAARTQIVRALLPEVADEAWFFDTELLLLAERSGLRIHEVPVDWVDDPDSRVDIRRTALEDLRGMWRVGRQALRGGFRAPVPARMLARQLPRGMRTQLPSFAVIGVASTLAYLLCYLVLRQAMPQYAANTVALAATAIANTAANRRYTFGVRGSASALRHQAEGGAAFLAGLVLTNGSLALLSVLAPGAGRAVELTVLIAANAAATLVRFLLLRAWVFNPRRLRRAATGFDEA
jgi:putative flippase GtrA